jgi:hypothetical protein
VVTCVITGESATTITIRVYGQHVEVPRSMISSVARASREENAALEDRWRGLHNRYAKEASEAKERQPDPARPTEKPNPEETLPSAQAPPPLSPARQAERPRPAPRVSPQPVKDTRKREILWRAEVRKAIAEKRVIPGMTEREVHSAWGWPEMTHPVHGVDGSTDRWTYRREGQGLVDLYFKDGILTHLGR